MNEAPQNPTPKIHQLLTLTTAQIHKRRQFELNEQVDDQYDQLEIFELIRNINDPQHPLTLQQLNVVSLEHCHIGSVAMSDCNHSNHIITVVDVKFTPTIPHCSMAQMIGLMIKVKVKVTIAEGTHANEKDINKQINDKERVAAALENSNIGRMLQRGFNGSDRFDFNTIY